MPIEFNCQSCQRQVRTPDSAAGKKGKCPFCGAMMDIPRASEPVAAKPPADRLEFPCPQCGSVMRTPLSAAGKKGRCAACGNLVEIPQAADASDKSAARAASEPAGKPAPKASTPPTPKPAAPDKTPAPSKKPPARKAAPGLTPISGATPGLVPLNPQPGLQPLSGGLTPLAAGDLTPINQGLTPLGSAGLTPLGPAGLTPLSAASGPAADPFQDLSLASAIQTAAATANPFQSPLAPSSGLAKSPRRSSGGFDFVSLLTSTWYAFWDNWGTCVVAMLVTMGISIAVSVAVNLLLVLLGMGIAYINPKDYPWVGGVIMIVIMVVVAVALMFAYCALEAGLIILMTRIAKGSKASVADLFSGGEYAGKLFAFHILQCLIQLPLGFALTVPGFFLAGLMRSPAIGIFTYVLATLINLCITLLLMPSPYLIVDREEGILSAIGESVRCMTGNILVAMGAFLVVTIGVMAFSVITIGVGILLAAPFFMLFLAVMYLKASRQKTAY